MILTVSAPEQSERVDKSSRKGFVEGHVEAVEDLEGKRPGERVVETSCSLSYLSGSAGLLPN